jgi:hypothetical protein
MISNDNFGFVAPTNLFLFAKPAVGATGGYVRRCSFNENLESSWSKICFSELLTLNHRVVGSIPTAPTIIVMQTINNPKARWEPAAIENIFGKLLGA